MSQTLDRSLEQLDFSQPLPPDFRPRPSQEIENDTPFGLQGFARDLIKILKPNCIERLAVTLSMRGTHQQIKDLEFVRRQLSFHPEWQDEYQVVHLVEKSLWLQGQSDLVMTMTKNPAKVPDNPPEKVLDALSRAYTLHPDATIWYGVPLFSDETNSEGLPIPVTRSEVEAEAERRILAAQKHALRWGWMYRAALQAILFPSRCWNWGRMGCDRVYSMATGLVNYWKRARRDSRNRAKAAIMAELERCRYGCSQTIVPEHGTFLGRTIDFAAAMMEVIEAQVSMIAYFTPFAASAGVPLAIASFIPKVIIPLTVVSIDPFLFVELPEEPGNLRHIGHWYWQTEKRGTKKLHVHV